MMRKVLLDTNMLIGAFDGEPGNVTHTEARKRFLQLMDDPDTEMVITPLVRYEALRGVQRITPDKMKAALDGFQEFNIGEKEANRAAEVYRDAKEKGLFGLDKDPEKTEEKRWFNRSFDLFYCVCAEVNRLGIESDDPHIKQIQQLIQGGKQNAQTHRH
jgi:predicted nucleic acid-binding protein